jgi:DNA-directed RNA polymerase subunit K/omega
MSSSKQGEEKQGQVLIGPPRLTRFERARIVGARALQLAYGAPPLIKVMPEMKDPIHIAAAELERGVLPIIIRRTLPDGTAQDIPLAWLLSPQKPLQAAKAGRRKSIKEEKRA